MELQPVWSLVNSGGIENFPGLSGIDGLHILAEHDTTSAKAVRACARRWYEAGREVLIVTSDAYAKDLNDELCEREMRIDPFSPVELDYFPASKGHQAALRSCPIRQDHIRRYPGLSRQAADAIRDVFNCAVVIVHHCGHEGTRPRGHSSLMGALDVQIGVSRDAANNILATVESMKAGRKAPRSRAA
jgi:hypothetical protein